MAVYVNNITIRTGEYFSRDFYLDNLDGSSLDLTGYSGSSQIRKHQESLNPTATFLLSFVDRSNGRIRLSLSAATTATLKPGRYVYDILFTDASGKKSIVIEGNILATQDVTLDGFGSSGSGSFTYDHYLLSYSATGITTSNAQYLATRTTVTSPDPQLITGYTGFSTVGYGYTNPYTPASYTSNQEVPAHVGIPTYLTYGGGWYNASFSFNRSAIGNNKIVIGDHQFYDYDASITGIAGTYMGAAYLFDINGNPLRQINAPDTVNNDSFGSTVEIDSGKIIIGDYYYSGTHEDQGAVYVFDMDGNYERRITLSSPAKDDDWPQAMAADNGKIFTSDSNSNVYIHNLDGTGEIKININSLTNPSGGSFGDFPIAAGNGKFVVGDYGNAYIFNQDGTGEIYLSDPDPANGSGYYGDQVAIGGNKVFVADPFWENASGDFVGKIYSYDMDGTNRSDIVTTDALTDVFYDTYNAYDKKLVASEDYVWYGAEYYYEGDANGAVYRWDIDGSNNVKIVPPSSDGFQEFGQMISADKSSGKFIVGEGDNGNGYEAYLYAYSGTGNPKRLTSGFDPYNEFVLLDVNNLNSAHSGIQQASLDLRAGFVFDVPPHPYAEVKVSVTGFKGGTMEKVGGTWINTSPTSTSVIGVATAHVGLTSELKDPGTRIALGDINLTDGTITFT